MNCELCGKEIPDNVTFCPSCGLPIDYDEHRPTIEDHAVSDTTPVDPLMSIESMIESGPTSGYSADPENLPDYPYEQETQELPPGTLPPPQDGFQDAYPPPAQGGYQDPYAPPTQQGFQGGYPPPPQQGYPGGFAPPPQGQLHPGTWGAPPAGYPAAAETKKKSFPVLLVVVLAIGVLILGGSAFAYFAFLRPAATSDAVTAMLDKYFDAEGSGDTATVASLHMPDKQPPQTSLDALSIFSGIMKLSYSDIQVLEINNSGDEMEVEITDMKLTMEAYGQKESISLGDMKEVPGFSVKSATIKLKRQDGRWMVNEPDILDPFMMQFSTTPTIPSTGSS